MTILPVILGLALAADANADLATAREQIRELKYPEAAQALTLARNHTGNERVVLVEILWLSGLVAATLGKTDDARNQFRTLCVLDGAFVPPGDFPPKVTGPFYEAKGWAATVGSLKVEATAPESENGHVVAVGVKVSNDTLKLTRRIRFHLGGEGGAWYVVDASLDAPRAAVAWKPTELLWWAELLGDQDAVLLTNGSQEQPSVVRSEAVAPPAPPPLVEATPASKPFFSPARGVGIAALVLGVAAGVVGAAFSADANTAAAQLRGLSHNPDGSVSGMTQRDAYALNTRANSSGSVATGFFIGGGVALGTGAVLMIIGAPGDAPTK